MLFPGPSHNYDCAAKKSETTQKHNGLELTIGFARTGRLIIKYAINNNNAGTIVGALLAKIS